MKHSFCQSVIDPLASFSREMNSVISSKNMRLTWRRMTYPQLSDPGRMEIISHGTRRSAGAQRVYSGLSIQGHAEVTFSFVCAKRIPADATQRCYHVQRFFVDRTMRKIDDPTCRDCVPLSVRAWKVSVSVRCRSSGPPTDVNFEHNFCPL